MLNNLGLGFLFTARDLASAKMSALEHRFASLDDRVTGGTERITGAFRQLGLGLGIFAASAATVAGAFVLAEAAGKFEQAIAAVAAVSGATANELEQLEDAAIDAGIATQFSPTEATIGLRELAQAGFNARESIGLLRPVLDLAAGSLGELTPQAAAGLAAQAIKAFGLGVEDAAVSVDRMLQAVNVFALNASELPLALGTAARGAQTLNQSLSETLIALGLVKNVVPGVERASTAVAVAMERLADPRTQERLRSIGVTVADGQGSFRSFLDVLGDMAPALDRMAEAQRSAFLLKAFGREALGGVNAMLTQVTNGIRTNTGETVKGAQAIAYLRKQFEEAGGTAAQFREKMLDTFAGQKQLLRGSLETLAIVLGGPFAQVFKPVVTVVVDALNTLLRFVRAMPAGMKKTLAALAVAAGAVTALVGAVIAAKAGVALLAIGFQALGISVGSILATLMPAILIVALLGAVVTGFAIAFEKNLGGIGDFAKRSLEKVQLFFGGLKQLFEQGGFSGAVRAELDKAENQGVKRFLVGIYQVGFRLQQLWEGIKTGFKTALEAAGPVFGQLLQTLSLLASHIATILSRLVSGAASLPSSRLLAFGQILGTALGSIVTLLVRAITYLASLATAAAGGFASMMEFVAPALETVAAAVRGLVATWNRLTGATATSSTALAVVAGQGRLVAMVLGKIVGGAVTVLALAFSGLLKVVTGVLWVADFFLSTARAIRSAFGALFDLFAKLGRVFPQALLPQGLAEAFASSPSLEANVQGGPSVQSPHRTSASVFPASASMPAVSEVSARTRQLERFEASALASTSSPAREALPFVVNVQVDGETVARAVNNAERSNAARAFSPVPAY